MNSGSVAILLITGPLWVPAICCNRDAQPKGVASYAIQHRYLDELSGLVVSRKNPNWIWVHNDSGDGPFLYAVQSDGKKGIKLKVTSAVANDWEDASRGRDSNGTDWLFIADTGRKKDGKDDKQRSEARQRVWIIEEPALPKAAQPTQAPDADKPLVPVFTKAASKKAIKIDLYFPKGADPDVEALFVLPTFRGLGFVSKKKNGKCRIYRGLFPVSKERLFPKKLKLHVFAELNIPGKNPIDRRITSACLDTQGALLFLISRTRLFSFPWPPSSGRGVAGKGAGKKKKKKKAIKPLGSWPLPKLQQSEAIDLSANNIELVIVSEGKPAVFHTFARPTGSAATNRPKKQ